MNRTTSHLSNLVVLALVALLLGPSLARADSTPVSLQFVHPISTSRDPDTDTSVRLSLLWARSGTVKALDLGLVATGTSGDMRGLQLVGFYGGVGRDLQGLGATLGVLVAKREVRGFQFSGITSWAGGRVTGGQVSAFVNYAGDGLGGIQLSGMVNINDGDGGFLQLASVTNVNVGDFKGLQLATFINHANREMNGAQVSVLNFADNGNGAQIGLINMSRRMKGLQLGVFNTSRDMDGVPIGLVNMTPGNPRSWIFYASTLSLANVGFRTEVNGWTSILSGGYGNADDKESEAGTISWHYGHTLGRYLGVDVGWVHIIPSAEGEDRTDEDRLHYALQARLTGDFALGRHVGLFAAAGVSTIFDRYATDANSETEFLAAGGVVLR